MFTYIVSKPKHYYQNIINKLYFSYFYIKKVSHIILVALSNRKDV